MSQLSRTTESGIETITADVAVSPDINSNINLVGDGATVTVTGNPATNTLTVSAVAGIPSSFVTDSGTATPALNVLNVVGKAGGNISTSAPGASNIVDIAISGTTDHAVQVGNASGSLTSLTVGTDGQVLIGATGADPAFATLTSSDSTITFTPGANSLSLQAAAAIPDTFNADTGSAIPAAHALTIAGGTNIATTGAGSTITVNFDGTLPVTSGGTGITSVNQGDILYASAANTLSALAKNVTATRYLANTGASNNPAWDQINLANGVTGTLAVSNGGTGATTLTDNAVLVGSGTSAVTPLAVGTDGQVLIGSTGADPVFSSITSSGGTLTFTPGAGTLNIETSGNIAKSFATDSGTATPAAGTITIAGGANISTSGSGSTVTAALDTALTAITSVTFNPSGILQTGTSATDNLTLKAYDVDGASYTTFATLTAGNTPTMDLDDSVTKASNYIYRAGGTDVPVTDGGTGLSSTTAYAVICGGTTSTGPLQSVSGTGTAGQVLTSNGAGALPTWQAASGGGGLTWTEVTGTSQTMSVNNGYIANNAALVTLTLPSTFSVGDVIRVGGYGAGGWKVAQNASQTIHFLSSDTTTGATGYLQSTNRYDAVELLCTVANTDLVVISSVGNITVA